MMAMLLLMMMMRMRMMATTEPHALLLTACYATYRG